MIIKEKTFQALTTDELYDILHLRLKVFVEEQNIVYVDTDYYDQQATHVMLYENNKMVSYLRVFKPGIKYKEASFGRFLTLKDYRNKGYGTALIRYVLSKYEAPIRISAQAYLSKYYQSFGFKEVTTPYIEEDILHVGMLLTKAL